MAHRIARLCCLLVCAGALTYAVAFLLIKVTGSGPFGAQQLVRPLFFITLWTIAPFIALLGVALRARGQLLGIGLVAVAFLIDASSIISMGGGFVFALLCGPLLLIALVATLTMRQSRTTATA